MNLDFCLQYHDGRIRVWRHRREHTLSACIRHRHTSPSSGVMTWGFIGFIVAKKSEKVALNF